MSVLYDGDMLLWGHLPLTDHLDELRTVALHWRGVEAEIERKGDPRHVALVPRIREIIADIERASEGLCKLDAEVDEMVDAQRAAERLADEAWEDDDG